jgi:predicted nucleic acid-binding protein
MSAKPRLLLDANVALDVLTKREPHYASSAAVWALVEQGKIEGYLAAHTVTTLHYLITKHLDRRQANLTITKLLQVFAVAAVNQDVLLKALTLNWPDFEDAVQMAAAFNAQADYLVTRNPKDFKDELVRVVQPGDLLALYSAS